MRSQIRSILEQLAPRASFTDAQDVVATCIVTSLSLLELIVALEDRFGVTVTQRDVFDGCLKSVDRMVELVAARQP